jgi:hypothetical protein
MVRIVDVDGDEIECLAKELSHQIKKSLQLTLDVTYIPKGVSVEELKARLEHLVRHGVGEGLLTGDTEVEVDAWDFSIKEVA